MCRIKYGREISNNEDVRNLITGVILRQGTAYYKDSIVNTVWKYLDGSTMNISKKEVNELVDNSLNVFGRNNEVICRNGKYRTVKVEMF